MSKKNTKAFQVEQQELLDAIVSDLISKGARLEELSEMLGDDASKVDNADTLETVKRFRRAILSI